MHIGLKECPDSLTFIPFSILRDKTLFDVPKSEVFFPGNIFETFVLKYLFIVEITETNSTFYLHFGCQHLE